MRSLGSRYGWTQFVRSALAGLLLAGAASAQALVLAVNEGVTYQVVKEDMAARYAGIAAGLSKILKQPVTVEPVLDYPSLRRGLADKRFDLAIVHPAHLSIEAMKYSGYHLVAVVRGYQTYQAQFLIRADSPLQSLADLKGHKLGAPDADSITSVMMRATLRDAGLGLADTQVVYTRYQDAVPFFVDNNLTQTGATAAGAVIKAWTAKGGRVLAKSKPVPIKHVIAAPQISPKQLELIRDYLLSLDGSEDGRKHLEPTRYTGFDRYDEAALLGLGNWLGL